MQGCMHDRGVGLDGTACQINKIWLAGEVGWDWVGLMKMEGIGLGLELLYIPAGFQLRSLLQTQRDDSVSVLAWPIMAGLRLSISCLVSTLHDGVRGIGNGVNGIRVRSGLGCSQD
jgi:hypothetical protein